jgi:hypothetical protein
MQITDLVNSPQRAKLDFKFSLNSPQCSSIAAKVIEKYGASIPKLPVGIEETIDKAHEAFNQNKEDTISTQTLRDLAYISLSLKGDDVFVYGLFRLIQALSSKRHFSALFASYVMHFDKNNKMCIEAAKLLSDNRSVLSNSWKRRLEMLDLLDCESVEQNIATQILKSKSETKVLNQIGLVGAFASSELVNKSYLLLAELVKKEANSNNFRPLEVFIAIIAKEKKIKLNLQVPAMIGLLSPFFDKPPPPSLKDQLQTLFTGSFSDPRISSSDWPEIPLQYGGQNFRTECLSLIKRWLIFETIELFFKVIAKHTPNEQFEPRKNLWKSYFDNNHVTDAHIILGRDAAKTAQHYKENDDSARELRWGTVSGGNIAADQSVLLMQIGSLIIAEWSHNGKFRAWDTNLKRKPEFHKNSYIAAELRTGSNKIRNKDGSFGDGIVHLGDWVERAKRYIDSKTDIRVARQIR